MSPHGTLLVPTLRPREPTEAADWLTIDGGISELDQPGVVLLVADAPITDDEDQGEVYTVQQISTQAGTDLASLTATRMLTDLVEGKSDASAENYQQLTRLMNHSRGARLTSE